MFDLEAAVDAWLAAAVEAQPDLARHGGEIADHLISRAQALVEDGLEPASAFARAVAQLGDPGELAGEFRKRAGLAGVLGRVVDAGGPSSRRAQLGLAGAWIGFSLFWAGLMVRFEDFGLGGFVVDGVQFGVIGWLLTTYLPLTVLGVSMTKNNALGACERRMMLRVLRRR